MEDREIQEQFWGYRRYKVIDVFHLVTSTKLALHFPVGPPFSAHPPGRQDIRCAR